MDEMFSNAIRLRNEERYDDAKALLREIIKAFPDHRNIATVHSVLAGILYDQNKAHQSLHHFKIATSLVPGSELASLGVYLSFIKIESYNEAIAELNRYLSKYKADMYLDTLEELIADLKNGYARDHESVIIRLAKKHNVPIV